LPQSIQVALLGFKDRSCVFMPYKSDAQRRYFNANRSKLERQGVDVDEWNNASKGKKLPERKKPKKEKFGISRGVGG
jgi:hypothetical protein